MRSDSAAARTAAACRGTRLRHEMEYCPASCTIWAAGSQFLPGTKATAEEVLDLKPDGVFLSNGPGDPEPLAYAIETIRGLLGEEADIWDLPGASTAGARLRCQYVQAEVWSSRGEPARHRSGNRSGRDHRSKPRFRRRRAIAARSPGDHPSQSERQTHRRAQASGAVCVQCAVPPRSLVWPSRQPLLIQTLSRSHAGACRRLSLEGVSFNRLRLRTTTATRPSRAWRSIRPCCLQSPVVAQRSTISRTYWSRDSSTNSDAR